MTTADIGADASPLMAAATYASSSGNSPASDGVMLESESVRSGCGSSPARRGGEDALRPCPLSTVRKLNVFLPAVCAVEHNTLVSTRRSASGTGCSAY